MADGSVAMVAQPADGGSISRDGMPHNMAVGADGNPADGSPEEFEPNQFRLEKLLGLTFNRSPDAVLEAWAKELLPPAEPSDDGADADADADKDAAAEKVSDQDTAQADTDKNAVVSGDKGEKEAGSQLADETTARESADSQQSTQDENADSKEGDSKGGDPKTDEVDGDQSVEAAEQAAAEAEKQAKIAKQQAEIETEVARFQQRVILGKWQEVEAYLASLREEDASQVYQHLLNGLTAVQRTSGDDRLRQLPAIVQPSQVLTPDDFVGLADAAPGELTETHIKSLSAMLNTAKSRGYVLNQLAQRLKTGTKNLGGSDPAARRLAAQVFLDCQDADAAFEFLPSWDVDNPSSDAYELRLLARYFDTKYQAESKPVYLNQSWQVHLALLDHQELNDPEKQTQRAQILRRSVELSTLVDPELGQQWLEGSFTENWEQGIRILSILGSKTASEMVTYISQPEQRISALKLQNKAAEMLLQVNPDQANQWNETLTRLAEQWLREAEMSFSLTRERVGGMNMDFDRYGNMFYFDEDDMRFSMRNNSGARQIPIRDLLEIRPSETWIAQINRQLQPRLGMILARLYLKINEAEKAFPFIESLAPDQPREALELVHEFIKTWTANHDPNNERRRVNPYMYIYGYNQQAEAIPLSRARQERNLQSLAGWVKRIRQLPVGPVDETLLASAFTTCHSSAEVFRVDAFQAVFGEMDSLKPETVAGMAATMRQNLASVWRQVRVQQAYQTNRKEPEIQQEVLKGYQVAQQIVTAALDKYPDNWQLQLGLANLAFDEIGYLSQVQPTSEFVERRDTIFQQFQQAARSYRDVVATLNAKQQTTDTFDSWFYAALGSTELGQISHESVPDEKQFPKILEAINSLPGETAEFHLARFANNLFSRISSVKPDVKHRYLRAGFQIVGDHPRARDAKKVYDYYNDVTAEIKLVAQIDGSDVVGHGQPFGVLIKLEHTTEMERESGGFQKYVQNQTQSPYAYNYGRPVEDYRDKFQTSVSKALSDHFEVVSVAFESAKEMRSRPADRAGWRQTPFAYVLLKSRGPQIDRLPALQLNLDFMDSSGYVVLPVESPVVPLDASQDNVPPRPFDKLKVVQTLDDRQLNEGKLRLEIQATARGLVPELEEILKLNFETLEVSSVDDQGVVPTEFDADYLGIAVKSDRSWLLELAVKPGTAIDQFTFCSAKIEDLEMELQRYADADIVAANPVTALNAPIYQVDWQRWILMGGLSLLLIGTLLFAGIWFVKSPRTVVKSELEMPEEINPFTVMGLLEKIEQNGKIEESQRQELQSEIANLQRAHFAPTTNGSVSASVSPSHPVSVSSRSSNQSQELTDLAHQWLKKAR